ncbi:MAG: formylglycine-generating enzyme family protein, partial [Candidatus Sumerlaeota bacterium]|nr:formylglycine-generating enzyme family protein [Candidatus Sumerlaeota bacterium]
AIIDPNPSYYQGASNPVDQVRWNEAMEFCRGMSEKTGKTYCLPTEAQWEYACQAGAKGEYCFGDSESQLKEYAWFGNNSRRETHLVGQKKPNQWGLYDMHGNVYEWCADWYGCYVLEKQRNPRGPSSGSFKVLRGGSWNSCPDVCRSAYRYNLYSPESLSSSLGFRVARTQG